MTMQSTTTQEHKMAKDPHFYVSRPGAYSARWAFTKDLTSMEAAQRYFLEINSSAAFCIIHV